MIHQLKHEYIFRFEKNNKRKICTNIMNCYIRPCSTLNKITDNLFQWISPLNIQRSSNFRSCFTFCTFIGQSCSLWRSILISINKTQTRGPWPVWPHVYFRTWARCSTKFISDWLVANVWGNRETITKSRQVYSEFLLGIEVWRYDSRNYRGNSTRVEGFDSFRGRKEHRKKKTELARGFGFLLLHKLPTTMGSLIPCTRTLMPLPVQHGTSNTHSHGPKTWPD